MLRFQRLMSAVLFLTVIGIGTLAIRSQERTARGEWRFSGGDKGFTRYSPLDQINRDNVARLRIVWRRPADSARWKEVFRDLKVNPYLRATPIMIDGVLYAPDAIGLLAAFDATTGKTIWEQEPFAATREELSTQSTRGIDFWHSPSGNRDDRLFAVRGEYLYALTAKTGKRFRDFGDGGRVNLHREGQLVNPFRDTSGPIVVGDVVVVAGQGGGGGDSGFKREAAPENVRGYDVHTGKLLWSFHVVPQQDEFGNETWGNESWKNAGNLAAWCPLSADEELGYVYLPLTAPTAAYFGGWRPGNNLYSDSLIALDAKTGKRVWHFQMVHHDLWDYDNVGPPTLGEITVNGKRIKAVMQANKNGFVYVFDRVTGEPVWPIVERPVPPSTTPGEHASPTQPFPTKPPAFDRQGLAEDDLIDFTPELRARALEIVKPYVLGALFTPPSVISNEPGGKRGTIVVPGTWGAANWHTGAFDPETAMYYAVSHTLPAINDLVTPPDAKATLAYEVDWGRRTQSITGPHGLPLTKPPYGRITAFNLNMGEQVWMAANGDGPRNDPLLKDLKLPPLGTPNRPAPLITKTLLLIGEGSDAIVGTPQQSWAWGKKFRAYDKTTGKVIWETELPAGTTGGPMTYVSKGKQYIVVAIGGRDYPPEWVALGLPPGGVSSQ